MDETPQIVTRAAQPYAAVKARVAMSELGTLGARLGEVFAWLGGRGLAPAGAPFFKYNVIDMAGRLEVEAGVPTASLADGDEQVGTGVLPAGRYATLTHVGHPDGLERATEAMLNWASEQGLHWDVAPGDDGERWAGRLEFYLTDPAEQPDMSKWRTQLAFLLADD